MQAIENDHLPIVTYLIVNMGANVNTPTLQTKRTPLMLALFKGNLEAAQLLIDKGAKVDLVDINGLNILHYAVDSNLLPSVHFALKHVSEVDLKDCKGWTPLMRAGNSIFFKFPAFIPLTSHFQKVAVKWTKCDVIKFCFAVILKSDVKILVTLLQHKAKWDHKDNNGFSCEQHWKMTYNQDVPPEIKTILSG